MQENRAEKVFYRKYAKGQVKEHPINMPHTVG